MTTEELKKLEDDLWTAATRLRSDSDLKLSDFATPVLGLIFLRFADNKYTAVENEISAELEAQKNSRRQREVHEIAIEKCGFYLPSEARYDYLLHLPEERDIAKAIKHAMALIEEYKPELKDVLPQDEYYAVARNDKNLPKTLLKQFSDIPKNATGDIFGKIYEFFLGKFAMAEGQGGGEFFTPTSVVKYMVEVIEPYQGTIFDPACGSGGMFVQSSNFVERRKQELGSTEPKDLFVYGGEKTLDTVKLAKMNIAVNGLRGEIKQANAYYEDPFDALGQFDYVMANPPFNVSDVNYDRVKSDDRFNTYGIPKNKSKGSKKAGEANLVPNGNYLWINLFATSLKPEGRAALVMANSASDAKHSERDIRETLIKKGLISQMTTLSSNMFSTVTLPASLWFFDKSNVVDDFEAGKEKIKILFVDARNVYRQVDRAHREFTQEQVWNLATITRLFRGESERFTELIHQYLEQVNQLLTYAKDSYGALIKVFSQLERGLKKWYQVSAFDEEKQKLIEAEKLDEALKAVSLMWDGAYLADSEAAQRALDTYMEKGNYSNEAQHEVAETLSGLNLEKKRVKKAIDKAVRNLEKCIKLAEKSLGAKTSADWKHLPSLKEVLEAHSVFTEYTSEAMNREPQATVETEGKSAFYFLHQALWLRERFPNAEYEDVTGLCKVAGFDEIEEQDFSLNPGRYVGVVIEEDGLTEEEFITEMGQLNTSLRKLSNKSVELTSVIDMNLQELLGDEGS